MAQGFDSSSDDDDDDIDNQNQNQDQNNDDNWINNKPKPMKLTKKEKMQIRDNTINNYLGAKSFAEMKNTIYNNKSPRNQNNINERHKSHNLTHRSSLNVLEHITQSTHNNWHIHPRITGVSAQTQVGYYLNSKFIAHKLKLSSIVHKLRNVIFRPSEFVAIRMKLKNPLITVTIFSNGKLTTQGGKSQISCIISLRKVAKMLSRLNNYSAISAISSPIFYGIQANAHCGYNIHLQNMSESFPNRCEYIPDIESSYLKYRQPLKYGDKGSCHVYYSGRITIMGAKTVKDTILWIQDMYKHTKPYFIYDDNNIKGNINKISNNDFNQIFNNSNNIDNNHALSLIPSGLAPPPDLI